jgi:hypothetical protein
MFELPDENIRSIRIPLSTIDSVQQNGKFLLRYRVVSKDKNKKSHWSKIYEVDPKKSFSELNGFTKPILQVFGESDIQYSSPPGLGSEYIDSDLVRSNVGSDSYILSWSIKDSSSNLSNFDVYVSWGYWDSSMESTYWKQFSYAGTTPTNTFAIQRLKRNINLSTTAVSFSNPYLTFYTESDHGLVEGEQISITDTQPTSYNQIWRLEAGTTGNAIVIDAGSNLGTITVPGNLSPLYQRLRAIITECAFPKITNITDDNISNILLSISDTYKEDTAFGDVQPLPFSTWNSPTGTMNPVTFALTGTATAFTTPRGSTVASSGGTGYVTIQTVGNHGFKVGQQVAITGAPTGFNAATRTITDVTSNTLTFFFQSSVPASLSLGSNGVVTSRNYFTISNLAAPFPDDLPSSPDDSTPILIENLNTFSGLTRNNLATSVVGSGGLAKTITILSTVGLDTSTNQTVEKIRL